MWKTMAGWFKGNAFQGQGIIFKILRFLHLMEDEAVRLSLTGLQMWATTILNIQTQIASHDHLTMGIAAATNASAMVAHGVERKQRLAAPAAQPPPWQGEADEG